MAKRSATRNSSNFSFYHRPYSGPRPGGHQILRPSAICHHRGIVLLARSGGWTAWSWRPPHRAAIKAALCSTSSPQPHNHLTRSQSRTGLSSSSSLSLCFHSSSDSHCQTTVVTWMPSWKPVTPASGQSIHSGLQQAGGAEELLALGLRVRHFLHTFELQQARVQ